MKQAFVVLSAVLAVVAVGCREQPPAVPQEFSVGGTVEGLEGSGLVLKSSTGEELAITANGAFTFPTKVAEGTELTISVAQHPAEPSQTCSLDGDTATRVVTQDLTNVTVKCATNAFLVRGSVTGLEGDGLVLQLNDTEELPVTADGEFAFVTPVVSGQTFTVFLKTQPQSPTQTCAVMGGSGTIGGGDVTTVVVNCATDAFVIGGTVSGLEGSGLKLQNNGGDEITVSANGTFAFPTPVLSGAPFAVTVSEQPSSPVQTCTVNSGTGSVGGGNVTTVAVVCSTNTYPVSGTVSGLKGTGLVLQNNAGDNLAVNQDGAFTFAAEVASGAMFAVTVHSQPTSPSQTCVVSNDSGLVTDAAITDVAVVCTTNTYAIGGTVTGLVGSGLELTNSNGDTLAVTADGAFAFAIPVESGGSFEVTISAQPTSPWQTCSVSGATGTVVSADVTSVTVNCATNQYAVGGTVSGLAGTGLELSLNGGPALSVSANGAFAFPTTLDSGASYIVTFISQPNSPWQTCTLAGDTGIVGGADVTSVAVTCTTNSYSVGGSVSGLAGSGLVLENNGETLQLSADGSFTFPTPVTSGQSYAVTVASQPTSPWQTCAVTSGTGTMGGANITNVAVVCVTNTYAVGGTVTGLAGGTLVLQNNAGDDLTLNANGTFNFATQVSSGGAYAVTVLTQPVSPWQTCTVSNGAGTVADSAIANVAITCVTNTYSVGGTVTGLAGGTLVLQNNGGNNLSVSANGAFTFTSQVASGAPFAVSVLSNPNSPAQTCTVSGGTGTVGGSNVSSVTVNCVVNSYTIGGTVSGLAGTGLTLRNNGGNDLQISGNGSFAFSAPVLSGQPYAVTVQAQPASPWQTCSVSNGSGTVGGANVTTVSVTCVTNTYNVGVQVSGLSGSGLVLQNNGGNNLSVSANGASTFTLKVASGQAYNVTVLSQPTSPWQTCAVASPTGTVGGANVTLNVTCVTNTYTVGGTVTGLNGTVVLTNNGTNDLTVTSNGTFTFTGPIPSGGSYAVAVKTQPALMSCFVNNGAGTVGSGPVTNVAVSCVAAATCKSIKQANPSAPNGNYTIDPDGSGPGAPIVAYCDMTTNGGGWTNLDFANNRVLLANGIYVACTQGLTYTATSITCNYPYFNGDVNQPLYHFYCDGSDSSANYIRDHMGPIIGHQNYTTTGFAGLSQSYLSEAAVGTNEYCYVNGQQVLYTHPLCAPYNLGNGNCIPNIFTLTK